MVYLWNMFSFWLKIWALMYVLGYVSHSPYLATICALVVSILMVPLINNKLLCMLSISSHLLSVYMSRTDDIFNPDDVNRQIILLIMYLIYLHIKGINFIHYYTVTIPSYFNEKFDQRTLSRRISYTRLCNRL